ncbi:hypothetical protein, partial [Subtercola boreus]|uniref:hypothetical protein n=1 Tax=Subtercola boreus TaxID=120213 RepID=UPI001C0F146B
MTVLRAEKSTIFFAYPGNPKLRAETMRDTARRLSKVGDSAQTWEDLAIEGRVLVDTICEAIDAADLVIAEISDLNSNVLFEAGFALARNKHLWLILDESDEDANRHWKEIEPSRVSCRFLFLKGFGYVKQIPCGGSGAFDSDGARTVDRLPV